MKYQLVDGDVVAAQTRRNRAFASIDARNLAEYTELQQRAAGGSPSRTEEEDARREAELERHNKTINKAGIEDEEIDNIRSSFFRARWAELETEHVHVVLQIEDETDKDAQKALKDRLKIIEKTIAEVKKLVKD